MARPLTYSPPPSPVDPVAAQGEDFLTALSETGLLRALTGAVRAYPDLSRRLVEGLDAEKLKAIVALGGIGDVLGSEGAQQVTAGIRSAVAAADRASSSPAPSVVTLVRQLADSDVRRGLAALIAAVGAFGRELDR